MRGASGIRNISSVTRALADIVARNIRIERGKRRWKQEELADLLGWGSAAVGAVEAGTRRINMDDLPGLCRVFGIPLTQLIDGADPDDLAALKL
jgi:transcriptional regulator with XRE-family HTH domain